MPDYLLEPVLSDGERAMIVLGMARVAYTTWAELGGIQADWDALTDNDKRRWGKAVRAAFRVMLNLMTEIERSEES